MRRALSLLLAAAVITAADPATADPASAGVRPLPDTYVLAGASAAAEGIAVRADGRIWVGSPATGRLYRGDVRRPLLTPVPATGTLERGTTLGVHTDPAGNVWSVGAGTLTVHDRHGRLRSAVTAPAGPIGPAVLNDLAVTRDAVYVTDFANPTVHRAERHGTRLGPLQPWLDMRTALPGFPAQFWFLNGIVADRDGSTLLVAGNGTEALWRVSTATRAAIQVDLGGRSFGADGMQLRGDTLYAVVNYASPNGVYLVHLAPGMASGTVTHRIPLPGLPTTLALHRCRVYVVISPGVQAVPDPACR
jgi:sugar lactone lactonase YvrE